MYLHTTVKETIVVICMLARIVLVHELIIADWIICVIQSRLNNSIDHTIL